MAITLTYRGNDDNVLKELAGAAGVAVPAPGNTPQNIEALESLLGLTLSFSGNDLNMLEALAAQYTPVSYKLDDLDGSNLIPFGAQALQTDAPLYLRARHHLIAGGASRWGVPNDLSATIDASGQTIGVEAIIWGAPYIGIDNKYKIGLGIAGFSDSACTVLVDSISAYFSVDDANSMLAAINLVASIQENLNTGIANNTIQGRRIGMWVNTATGQIGIVAQNAHPISNPYPAEITPLAGSVKIMPWLLIDDSGLNPCPIVGQEASVELVTSAADMMLTFPPGTVDIFGEPIGV